MVVVQWKLLVVTAWTMMGRLQTSSMVVEAFAPLVSRHKKTRVAAQQQQEYYGESCSMVQELSQYDQLLELVQLASKPLPTRPDGIVTVCKYTSVSCQGTEAEYERLARDNPATLFLRCYSEYDNAHLLLGQAQVTVFPTFDMFYRGNRVSRVEQQQEELINVLHMHQFQNSKLDLFSENSSSSSSSWGDKTKKNYKLTPRTTARFIPGYDFDKDRGFFDDLGDKLTEQWDTMYGNWVPDIEED